MFSAFNLHLLTAHGNNYGLRIKIFILSCLEYAQDRNAVRKDNKIMYFFVKFPIYMCTQHLKNCIYKLQRAEAYIKLIIYGLWHKEKQNSEQ